LRVFVSLFLLLVGHHEVIEVEKMEVEQKDTDSSAEQIRSLVNVLFAAKSDEKRAHVIAETQAVYACILASPNATGPGNNSNTTTTIEMDNLDDASSLLAPLTPVPGSGVTTRSQLEKRFGRKASKRASWLEGFRLIARVYAEHEDAWFVPTPQSIRRWGLPAPFESAYAPQKGVGGANNNNSHNVSAPNRTEPAIAVDTENETQEMEVEENAPTATGRTASPTVNNKNNTPSLPTKAPSAKSTSLESTTHARAIPDLPPLPENKPFVLHPWIDFNGRIDHSMLASIANLLTHSIAESPGISESDLLARASALMREGAVRDVLRALELQDCIEAKFIAEVEPVGVFSDARKVSAVSLCHRDGHEFSEMPSTRKKIYFARPDLIWKLDGLLNHAFPRPWVTVAKENNPVVDNV
jgi:hypothetical protein